MHISNENTAKKPTFITIPRGKDLLIKNINDFNLEDIFTCGQSFRFESINSNTWQGVAFGKVLRIAQNGKSLLFYDTNEDQFSRIWYDYFDLSCDYRSYKKDLASDNTLRKSINYASGIRILRQDKWETLCSFIISQNNNIPRIKSIISNLCKTYGEEIETCYAEKFYSFPSPQCLSELTPEDLSPLKAGFRAKYIIDCAKKVADKSVDFDFIEKADKEVAREHLKQIVGVGTKVADCTLLFGFGKKEVFPIDTWISKAMEALFPNGLPDEFAPIAGVAQQYLFHYVRNSGILNGK